ncbi:MAG: hypothetical protein JJ913_09495 [Rhizobiaceae bacterium]|nr:hypothetical protein [Rhizobiaceae bacterium]
MPLQNRVDPFGEIHANSSRGLFTGNRGVIHDPDTRTLLKRRWTTKAWIICDLVHPRGRKREVFGRNAPSGRAGWTELFFTDEVTALAAGHRPCFYCRREAAKRYATAFADAFGLAEPRVAEIDGRLHAERLASGANARELSESEVRSLPDGAMISLSEKPFALNRGKLLPWGFGGYAGTPSSCRSLPAPAFLITPATSVAVLRAGYRPVWHPSAP